MKSDLNVTALPPDIPANVRAVIRRCLEKDPIQRIRDAGDVRLAMEGAFDTLLATPSERVAISELQWWQRPLPAGAAVLAAVVLTGFTMWSLTSPGPTPAGTVTRFPFVLPDGDVINQGDGIALSPDGRILVYAGERDGQQQLFVRARDQVGVRPLPGTEGAVYPFFSPNGAWIGFFTEDSLKKVALAGGPPQTLCEVGYRRGATWGPDDTIVFASGLHDGLMRVSASGGEPQPLTEPEENSLHRWPVFVPGGEAVLYTASPPGGFVNFEVAILSLSSGAQETLVRGAHGTAMVSGRLVFAREASLWAVPFDSDNLTVTGEPVPVVEGVQVNDGGWAQYALANDGTLVYLPPVAGSGPGVEAELVWVDRGTGEETPLRAPGRPYEYPRISPDGRRVAVHSDDGERDIWIWDLEGATLGRLTVNPGIDAYPEWTPDSQHVIYGSARDGNPPMLFRRPADGTGSAEPLHEAGGRARFPQAVTPDGTVVLAVQFEGFGTSTGFVTLTLGGDQGTEDLLVTEFEERSAVISPDGDWFAYESDASGVFEVYVRPFPDADAALHQVSAGGGRSPLSAPDGSELYYEAGGRVMAVPVQTAPDFSRGRPTPVVEGNYLLSNTFGGRWYDIEPTGQRFLMLKPAGAQGESVERPSLTFVLNWDQELIERAPIQ